MLQRGLRGQRRQQPYRAGAIVRNAGLEDPDVLAQIPSPHRADRPNPGHRAGAPCETQGAREVFATTAPTPSDALRVTTTRREDVALASWIARVAGKADEEAFEQLFRHYGPSLHRYVRRCGIGSHEADELVQETMLKVWQYDASLGDVDHWVCAIARNLCYDSLRRQGESTDRSMALQAERPPFDVSEEHRGEFLLVMRWLDEFALDQVAVLKLAYLNGLSQADINRQLCVPLGTVKSRTRLALRNLRRKLNVYS